LYTYTDGKLTETTIVDPNPTSLYVVDGDAVLGYGETGWGSASMELTVKTAGRYEVEA